MGDFYSRNDLSAMGVNLGKGTPQVSKLALLLNPESITLGSNVRIDAFSLLSAGDGFIRIGDQTHISHGARVYGGGGVVFGRASGLSSGACVYSQTDNFSSGHLAHPTIPDHFRDVISEEVRIGDFCAVGANSVLLPGSQMGDGSRLGALSLLSGRIEARGVYAGIPARSIGSTNEKVFTELRSRYLLEEGLQDQL